MSRKKTTKSLTKEIQGLDIQIEKGMINEVIPEIASSNPVILPKDSLSETLAKRKDMQNKDFHPKIVVIGVGGAGGNAVNNLIRQGLEKVTTIACNTDAQALESSLADIKIKLGPKITMGHGAGANLQVGKLAAQESYAEIQKVLEGVHMAFIVAGLGGGTGSGAGPEIGKIALDMGVLTVGFVTTPFEFEGAKRKVLANQGLDEFQDNTDVLVVVGNQNLFSISNEETTFLNAFALADEVLCTGVKSVVRTVSESGLINTDLADFFTIMKGRKSRARMGTGTAEGLERGARAAQEAMASPLLELGGMMAKDIDGVIICIRCGDDVTLTDINQAVDYIRQSVSSEANLIFGATIDPTMEGKIQVSIFATTANKEDEGIQNFDYDFSSLDQETDEVIDSFEQLISEDFELGRPHGATLHEDNFNIESGFESVYEPKLSLFRRVFGFFSKSKEKKIPPYFRK